MKKLGRFLMVLSFLIPLVIVACTGQQATPAPAATTIAPPKSVVTEKPAAPAQPKEPVKVEILSCRPDTTGFPLSQALADIVTKNSSWVRVSNVQTPGMSAAMQMFAEEANKRPTSIVLTTEDPYTDGIVAKRWGPTNGLFFIFRMGPTPIALTVFDPKIKTKDDLVGKRIGVHRKGTYMANCETDILKAWGILDKVKVVEGSFGGHATALKDGLIDMTFAQIDTVGVNQYAISSIILSAASGSPVYFINLDKETMDKVYKETKSPYGWHQLPARTLGATQLEPLGTMGQESFWMAGPEMKEDVVYEVVKMARENVSQFALYHVMGKTLTKDNVGLMFRSAPGRYHPGAAKYFKEAGVPMGEVEWNR